MTASSTVGRHTRIWMHVQYVRHHGRRLDEMILAMLRVKNVIGITVPPLIVPNQYGSNEVLMPKKSLVLSELDSLEHYFGQSRLNMEEIAAILGCQTFEKAEVVDQWRARYEPGRSLFDPQRLHELDTQMFAINKWCIEASKSGENWISVRIRQHHYFRGDDLIYVQFEEVHQLCHLDALDKSLVSCFCL